MGGSNGDGHLSRQVGGTRTSIRTADSPQETLSGIVVCAITSGCAQLPWQCRTSRPLLPIYAAGYAFVPSVPTVTWFATASVSTGRFSAGARCGVPPPERGLG